MTSIESMIMLGRTKRRHIDQAQIAIKVTREMLLSGKCHPAMTRWIIRLM